MEVVPGQHPALHIQNLVIALSAGKGIAQDEQGYMNLMGLSSAAYRAGVGSEPDVTLPALAAKVSASMPVLMM